MISKNRGVFDMAKKINVYAFYKFDAIEDHDDVKYHPTILLRRKDTMYNNSVFSVISSYFYGNSCHIENFSNLDEAFNYIDTNFLKNEKYKLIEVK
jgi:hypothetical protein